MNPAIGDPIVVVVVTDRANLRSPRAARRARVIDSSEQDLVADGRYFKWRAVPSDFDGIAFFEEEGVSWARGWDEETAGALLAANALVDDEVIAAIRRWR